MKRRLLIACLTFLFSPIWAQNNVGIGTAIPNPTSLLELQANDKGLLVPRMPAIQRLAIASPANGLLVYDTDSACFFFYKSSAWTSMCSAPPQVINCATQDMVLKTNGTGASCGIIYDNGMKVGVNTTLPAVTFQVNATDGIGIPAGTTAQRPSSFVPTGTMRYNTTLGTVEVYTGTCWQNVNTPPIGSTYVQWYNAADPNALYSCTQWVATDMQNGEFIRAVGGASNVAAGSALTGTLQTDLLKDHTHTASGTAAGAGVLTTSTDGDHSHNWGGNWSNDDSRQYTSDNGDGTGNTISDGNFWWGGASGTTTTYTNQTFTSSGVNPVAGNIYIPYDDNLSSDVKNLSMDDNPTQCGTGWDGRNTVGNFMGRLNDGCMNHSHTLGVSFYAHRHWIKTRPTTTAGAHFHTVPDHTHILNITVGNMTSGGGAETRPVNVAVVFWRRVN